MGSIGGMKGEGIGEVVEWYRMKDGRESDVMGRLGS
jgi:hypothetical protein